MSEQSRSENPVIDALNIEKDISLKLTESNDRARKEVRDKMENWLELMNDAKTRKAYAEELGDLDPEAAKAELLETIHGTYPKIAAQLGWTPEMRKQEISFDQAA